MSDENKVASYRDLIVWQKAIRLVKSVYQITTQFPADEKFGIVSQMRRAAVSVPSNIAEGQARCTSGEFVHFISNAEGSLAELDTQVVLGVELQFMKQADASGITAQVNELRRMLNSLRRRVKDREK